MGKLFWELQRGLCGSDCGSLEIEFCLYSQNVHDDSEGPDVTGLVVLLWTQDLGGWKWTEESKRESNFSSICALIESERLSGNC